MAAGGDGDNNSEKANVGKEFGSRADIKPGCQIWCKTRFGDEFQGEVMAYDRETKALIISILFKKKSLILEPGSRCMSEPRARSWPRSTVWRLDARSRPKLRLNPYSI